MVNNYYGRRGPNDPPPEEPKKFDLVASQAEIRDCMDSKKVYLMLEDIYKLHERKEINFTQFEEMRDIIVTQLEKLKIIKESF